jgi:voltage-gated potassium channel
MTPSHLQQARRESLDPLAAATARLLIRRIAHRFLLPTLIFAVIMLVGAEGYRYIGGPKVGWVDAFYMTYITIATIGYGEIIDLTNSPGGRVFTMFIAGAGIVNFTYMMSAMTAFLVEFDFNQAIGRRRMQRRIDKLSGHYVVAGIGRVGDNVTHELEVTGRPYVVIDVDRVKIDAHLQRCPDALFLHGDAGEDEVLLEAGVARAAGVFAITGDDSKNLVIVLSAKQLNPAARVVARCHEVNFVEKIRRVGADDIVSPDFTGGMRIVSSMIRPHVVTFLDEMLRADKSLRVEEVVVPAGFEEAQLASLKLHSAEYVLLAVRGKDGWSFNPLPSYPVSPGDALIVMTTPHGRRALEARFSG